MKINSLFLMVFIFLLLVVSTIGTPQSGAKDRVENLGAITLKPSELPLLEIEKNELARIEAETPPKENPDAYCDLCNSLVVKCNEAEKNNAFLVCKDPTYPCRVNAEPKKNNCYRVFENRSCFQYVLGSASQARAKRCWKVRHEENLATQREKVKALEARLSQSVKELVKYQSVEEARDPKQSPPSSPPNAPKKAPIRSAETHK